MSHIASRQPGKVCMKCSDNPGECHIYTVNALVVSEGVFMIEATSQVIVGEKDVIEFSKPVDMVFPLGLFCWYESDGAEIDD